MAVQADDHAAESEPVAEKKTPSTRRKSKKTEALVQTEHELSEADVAEPKTPSRSRKLSKTSAAKSTQHIKDEPVTLKEVELLSETEDDRLRRKLAKKVRNSGNFSLVNEFQSGAEMSPPSTTDRKIKKEKLPKHETYVSPILEKTSGKMTRIVNTSIPSPRALPGPVESPYQKAKRFVAREARRAADAAQQDGNGLMKAVFIITACLSLIAFGYARQLRLQAGYCDNGLEPNQPIGIFALFNPTCFPCPFRGECSHGELHRCETGFLIRHSLFSSLWPSPATCAPDTVRQRRIEWLITQAKTILNQRAGEVICGEITGADAGLTVPELRERVEVMRDVCILPLIHTDDS